MIRLKFLPSFIRSTVPGLLVQVRLPEQVVSRRWKGYSLTCTHGVTVGSSASFNPIYVVANYWCEFLNDRERFITECVAANYFYGLGECPRCGRVYFDCYVVDRLEVAHESKTAY